MEYVVIDCILNFLIPMGLFILCSISWGMERKNKKTTLEELKDFYWSKNSNGNERIGEKYYSIDSVAFELTLGCFMIFFYWNFATFMVFLILIY